MLATMLNIIPIMHLDAKGAIIAYAKVRGKKAAIEKTVKEILESIKDGVNYNDRIIIGHTDCMDMAKQTEEALKAVFAKAKTCILDIGNIIASHCGPGTIAVFFMGEKERV